MLWFTLPAFILGGLCTVFGASGSPQIGSTPAFLIEYEVVQIGKVVATPQVWNLRLVRFKGMVTALRSIPRGPGMIPRESHVFTLRDETGEIEVFYTGTLGYIGPLETDLLVEGNSVDALVTITYLTSPGSEGGTLAGKLGWVGRLND
jgi:hypothetical protein